MPGRIAAIAFDRDRRARVEPTDIRRRGTFDDDFRPRHSHRADALTRITDDELELFAVETPQWSADVVLTGRVNLEFGFAVRHRGVDFLKQDLGGLAFVVTVCGQVFHCRILWKLEVGNWMLEVGRSTPVSNFQPLISNFQHQHAYAICNRSDADFDIETSASLRPMGSVELPMGAINFLSSWSSARK